MLQRPKLADEAINSMNRQFNNLDECFEFINEKCSSDL